MSRAHKTFRLGNWELWADRVPVMHGCATLYTIWKREADGAWYRLKGGCQLKQLRRFIELWSEK